MDVLFRTKRLKRDCTEERWMRRAHGERRANILRRRLGQLRAAENLEILRLAHPRAHELQGNHEGIISLDLDGGNRLLIEPAEDPAPTKPDGGLDWTRVTAVLVVGVGDPHD